VGVGWTGGAGVKSKLEIGDGAGVTVTGISLTGVGGKSSSVHTIRRLQAVNRKVAIKNKGRKCLLVIMTASIHE
jgi:hypothetical protein